MTSRIKMVPQVICSFTKILQIKCELHKYAACITLFSVNMKQVDVLARHLERIPRTHRSHWFSFIHRWTKYQPTWRPWDGKGRTTKWGKRLTNYRAFTRNAAVKFISRKWNADLEKDGLSGKGGYQNKGVLVYLRTGRDFTRASGRAKTWRKM